MPVKTLVKCCLLSVSLIVFAAKLGACQAPQSRRLPEQITVRGKVTDTNQAVVRGARITAQSSQYRVVVVTDQNGEFAISLDLSAYTLNVVAEGFMDAVRQVKRGELNQTLDIVLEVGVPSATITVTDSGGYQIGAVSSATRTDTLLRDVPQSVTVISKEQIRDQSMQSIADVVNYVPGITSHQGENNRDQLVIRGNATSADFFLNGVRDDVQYYRDLYNVDRVEALKGPNAMTFGRGGGGGVINRVTKER